MAILHRGPGAHGRVRRFWSGAYLRFQGGRCRLCAFRDGTLHREYWHAPARFLEMFKSNYYADLSLDTWMAWTPPKLIDAHLKLDQQVMNPLRKDKAPVVP